MEKDILKKDLEEATKLINVQDCLGYGYNKYCCSFIFGTENQEGINNIISYDDKDVLTVASSGDQYLSAIYYGANNVDLFDINRITYYISYLKIASVIALDYCEFVNFFVPTEDGIELNKSFWNLATFKKVIPYLPSDVAYFWENIMYLFKKQRYGLFVQPLLSSNILMYIKRGMPFYKNEENYCKLKNLLKSKNYPKFLECDISVLDQYFVNKYDVVYLSNIIECIIEVAYRKQRSGMPFSSVSEDDVEFKVMDDIIKKVRCLLNDDGVALVSYRSNRNMRTATDYLFNNNILDVAEVPCKVLPYDDYESFFTSDLDLVLTFKPDKSGRKIKK